MMKPIRIFFLAGLGLGAIALEAEPKSESGPEHSATSSAQTGFRFPGGDAEAGRAAFERLNCVQCHRVTGVDLAEPKGKRRLDLVLGIEPRFARSYEGLVVAITNPRHVINEQYRAILSQPELEGGIEPFMPELSVEMSARDLMDLVAFLDSVYRESLPAYGRPAGDP